MWCHAYIILSISQHFSRVLFVDFDFFRNPSEHAEVLSQSPSDVRLRCRSRWVTSYGRGVMICRTVQSSEDVTSSFFKVIFRIFWTCQTQNWLPMRYFTVVICCALTHQRCARSAWFWVKGERMRKVWETWQGFQEQTFKWRGALTNLCFFHRRYILRHASIFTQAKSSSIPPVLRFNVRTDICNALKRAVGKGNMNMSVLC